MPSGTNPKNPKNPTRLMIRPARYSLSADILPGMAAFNGSTTNQALWIGYDDNASYREDNDVTKAKNFQTICTILLRRTSSLVQEGGAMMQKNLSVVENRLKAVDSWLDANDTTATGPMTTFGDLTEFR